MSLRYRRVMTSYKKAIKYDKWWNLDGLITPANCKVAYQPKGAASYAASKVNLANPGNYDAAEGTAPSWATGTGWTGNGTDQELYVPTLQPLGSDDWSFIIKINVDGGFASDRYPCCLYQTTSNMFGTYINGGMRVCNGNYHVVGAAVSCVAGAAGLKNYYNGNYINDGAEAWCTDLQRMYLLSRKGANYFDGTIEAFALYDIVLTGGQMAALTTAMNAL